MKSSSSKQKHNSKKQQQYLCYQQDQQQQNYQEERNEQLVEFSDKQQSQNNSSQEQYQLLKNEKPSKTHKKEKTSQAAKGEERQNQIETVRYFPQKDQPIRDYDQKVVIARHFCKNKGLDYDNMMRSFQKYKLNCYMNKDKYRRLLYSFVNDVVRALQRYIVHQLNQDIQQFRRRQLRDALPFLLKCRSNFTLNFCDILTNFTKFVFELTDVELQPNSLIFLHSKIGELISNLKEKTYKTQMFKRINKQFQKIPLENKDRRRKSGPPKPNSMDEINKIWTERHEKLMIEKYKETHSFRMIKQHFCRVFFEHRFIWTRQNIGRRFQRVLRRGLAKLKTIIQYLTNVQKVAMPELINLDHKMIKILVRRPSFIDIRLMFVDLLEGKKDIDFVRELIDSVNEEMGIVRDKYQMSNEHANIGKQLEYFREIEKIKL